MKSIVTLVLAGTLAVAMSSGAMAKKSCVKAGGQGTGVTADIAKFMATAALNNSIKSYGGKASGKSAMVCKADLLVTNCTASQRVCK